MSVDGTVTVQYESNVPLSMFQGPPPGDGTGSVKASDSITRIYACATMWHESEEEQLEMLKSLFRTDTQPMFDDNNNWRRH